MQCLGIYILLIYIVLIDSGKRGEQLRSLRGRVEEEEEERGGGAGAGWAHSRAGSISG